MPNIDLPTDTDVLVIGAGPVGLALGLQLARAGIKTLVVERRATPSRHPKANGIFSRTMESFRQWGLAERVAQLSLPPELCLGFVWTTRISGIELGRIMFADDVEELRAVYSRHSPEIPRFAPQDRIEQLLAAEIRCCGAARLHYGAEAVGIEQDPDGATVRMRHANRAEQSVRARFVVAADGSRSSTKALLGLEEEASEPWGESVNIYFESEEFDALRGGRPYQLWWVINENVRGAFWPVSHRHRWIFTPEGVPGADSAYYTDEVCAQLVRHGAGAPVHLKILSAMLWSHEMGIASRWRSGRVFLAGDAAHRFPPHGGFGMNSGIQDAHNLGWKLIAVLRGEAGSRLLDSYEAERKPVALANAALTARNAELIKETGWFVPEPAELASIEQPEGRAVREKIGAAVLRQAASVHSNGQQFGAVYRSGAIVSDGSEPPESSVADYMPSASPGARAPHIPIVREGKTLSVVDLFRFDRLVLLTLSAADAWKAAAQSSGARIEVTEVADGSARSHADDFLNAYGLERDGAVLVRPDGYVAYRAPRLPPDPAAALRNAAQKILDL